MTTPTDTITAEIARDREFAKLWNDERGLEYLDALEIAVRAIEEAPHRGGKCYGERSPRVCTCWIGRALTAVAARLTKGQG